MIDHCITPAQIKAARQAFQTNEPRDLFYRAASELVSLALAGKSSLTVGEALGVLLQTWNKAYYQYRKFDARHFAQIEILLKKHRRTVGKYRQTTIQCLDQFNEKQRRAVSDLFEAFESILGPVGAAKALHLLAPKVFALWDRKIAENYGLALGPLGQNGDRYWRFLIITQRQCSHLRETRFEADALKLIDEYNYCRFTKGWLNEVVT